MPTELDRAADRLRQWGQRFAQMGTEIEAAREAASAAELQREIARPGLVNRMVYLSVLVQVPPGASDHDVITRAADYMRSVPDVLEYLADRVSPELPPPDDTDEEK